MQSARSLAVASMLLLALGEVQGIASPPLNHYAIYLDKAEVAFVRDKIAEKRDPWYGKYQTLIERADGRPDVVVI